MEDSEPASFVDKAGDLKTLQNAVVDAAAVSAGFWFSYIFVLFYLLIAVGGVTHRDLFLENPVKLPFLNVELPLTSFFLFGPAMFLIVHAYVLMHFVLLADKIGAFHRQLKLQVNDDVVRTSLRRQLPSNIFVQFLAGPREVRTGSFGFLLRLIARISLLFAPIALLIFFQLQFLPYHDPKITWCQRAFVVADIILLWKLWPSIVRGKVTWIVWRDLRGARVTLAVLSKLVKNIWQLAWVAPYNKPIRIAWRNLRRVTSHNIVPAAAAASVIPILFVLVVATFPGEGLYELPSLEWIPTNDLNGQRRVSLHEYLFVGEVDYDAAKSDSLFSDRLVLPKLDIVDHNKYDTEAKFAAIRESISLRTRHLEAAVLSQANLTKADFHSAILSGAQLDNAQLRGAEFSFAILQGADLSGAQLQGATFKGAHLEAAALGGAQLQGASLDGSLLHGAWLDGARLEGASLDYAQLTAASLDYAQLQGASLRLSNLQGASLIKTNIQNADLTNASVWLADTHMDTQFKGKAIRRSLQADRVALAKGARFTYFLSQCDGIFPKHDCTIELVRQRIAANVPQGKAVPQGITVQQDIAFSSGGAEEMVFLSLRDAALKRVEKQLGSGAKHREPELKAAWLELDNNVSDDEFEKDLDNYLLLAGCGSSGTSYVIHGLLNQKSRPIRPALAASLLRQERCADGYGLSEVDKALLKELRERPSLRVKSEEEIE